MLSRSPSDPRRVEADDTGRFLRPKPVIHEHDRVIPSPVQTFPESVMLLGSRLAAPVSRMGIYPEGFKTSRHQPPHDPTDARRAHRKRA